MDISDNSQPIYLQVKNYILTKIDNGSWKAGMKVASEAELVNIFNASRMTVNRALRELTAEGVLTRKQGHGTFVAQPTPQSALLEIRSIADEIKTRGENYSCIVHLLSPEKASPQLADSFGCEPYATLFHSVLIHRENDIPLQVSDRYVNPAIAPDYLKQDFTQITPNDYLLSLAPIDNIEHRLEALIPEAWIRELLQINEAEPCFALRRTTWIKQTIATLSVFYHPGSRYSFSGKYSPTPGGAVKVI